MEPVPFAYQAPQRLPDAVALLVDRDDAHALAGGQSLLAAANLREVRPGLLVDLRHLPELRGVTADGSPADGGATTGSLRIGAGEPMTDVAAHPLIARHTPLLASVLATVGSVAIRNRATLGGSVAWADPTSQLPAALLALDAAVLVHGRDGPRRVAAADCFVDRHRTVLRRGDIVTAIEVPVAAPDGVGLRMVRRTAITWPVAGCVAVRRGGTLRLGLFGAAERPLMVDATDEAAVADAVVGRIAPFDDARASAGYRRAVLPELARRAARDATTARAFPGATSDAAGCAGTDPPTATPEAPP